MLLASYIPSHSTREVLLPDRERLAYWLDIRYTICTLQFWSPEIGWQMTCLVETGRDRALFWQRKRDRETMDFIYFVCCSVIWL